MDERFGQLRAELAESSEDAMTAELVRLINQNIKPLQPVTADDVVIRSMYIVSDQVNSYGGKFPADEHERLSQLLIDSPVLVGHRKDALPIGRNFFATTVERNGRPWVRSYFYWLSSANGAEHLRENIDKGVYKECSIGFTYLLPECSVCGEDIRRCRHSLFQTYNVGETEQVCHFRYRQIQKVLETSLVYRGAIPDTAISNATNGHGAMAALSDALPLVSDLGELKPESSYLVVPHYEGIAVTAKGTGKSVAISDINGTPVEVRGLTGETGAIIPESGVHGKLVGYRGKERCSVEQLRGFLTGGRKPVTRVVLYLYPDDRLAIDERNYGDGLVRRFRHRFTSGRALSEMVAEMSTKSGTEIWEINSDGSLVAGVRYCPAAGRSSSDQFRLYCPEGTSTAVVSLNYRGMPHRFVIHQFSFSKLTHGVRFVADSVNPHHPLPAGLVLRGHQIDKTVSGGYRMQIPGERPRELRIQPVQLNGRRRYLAYLKEAEE